MTKRSPLLRFFRTWMLAFAMLAGVGLYFGWIALPFGAAHEGEALTLIKIIQPWLIFTMLFVTFCKVDPRHLRLRRWHGQHLIFQTLFFLLPGALIWCFPTCTERPVLEGLMLCFICPTATSCAVVTGKLGGDIEGVTTYTILINLLAALLIPMAVPLISPHAERGFLLSFLLIMGKVFPMLICPFLTAWAVRLWWKSFHVRILRLKDFAFYLWAVCLMLAITTSTHALMHTRAGAHTLIGIAGGALIACISQFAWGRCIGRHIGEPVAPSQALGQKNTVFAIWAGYTFFDPVSSMAGGFYSICHNVWNSYQLSQIHTTEMVSGHGTPHGGKSL